MKEIMTNDEMLNIQFMRKGFILNARPESRKIHSISCEAVHAMVATAHPKYFSADRDAAKEWLDRTFGRGGWTNCGLCSGLGSK
jgi:hypothetical protein